MPENEQNQNAEQEQVAEAPPAPPAPPKITADQLILEGGDEGAGSDGSSSGETDDPLAALSLTDLLNHPKIGPAVQSWADSSGNARLEAVKAQTRAELEAAYEFNQLDAEFSSMSREEWAEQVAENPSIVDRYARYRSLLAMREGNQANQQVEQAAEVQSMVLQIKTYSELLKGSGLSEEEQAKLNPQNFTKKPDGSPAGRAGIVAWGTAIHEAMVQAALAAKWETYKTDQLARQSGTRKGPVLTNGQNKGGVRLTKEVLKNMDPREILKIPQADIDKVLAS